MIDGIEGGARERQRILSALRAQASEMRRRGVRRLRVTGSVARGQATEDSDVDLLVEIDRAGGRRFSLLDLADLELRLGGPLGRQVQVITSGDSLHPRVRAAMEADAIDVLDGYDRR